MSCYRVYGHTLATDHRLSSCLEPSAEDADVVFVCRQAAETAPASQELVYRSVLPGYGDEGAFALYRLNDDAFRLHYPLTADFVIRRDRIDGRLFDPRYEYWVEIALLGPVLSFWLELRGSIALHAAAVVVGGQAIGFIASSKSGKTSLAASFMAAGAPLLTDDILPLFRADTGDIMARSGFPQLRMWPDQVRSFVGDPDGFPLAHPEYDKRRIPAAAVGRFQDEPVRLGALFLPERTDTVEHPTVTISQVQSHESFMALLQTSFAASVVEQLPELQIRRLSVIAEILTRVPVLRLSYPDGFDHLPEVRSRITGAVGRHLDPGAPPPVPS